jgi:cytochrome P450
MTPPGPAELAREVLPGGTTVEGQFFPPDTKVSTCLYCLSYNNDVFPEAFKFRPERFLDVTEDPLGDSKENFALAESGVCAFSTGSRGCVGKNMAWLEMQIVLPKMVFSFELRQDPSNSLGGGSAALRPGHKHPNQFQIYDAFVAMRDGPMIQFRQRR